MSETQIIVGVVVLCIVVSYLIWYVMEKDKAEEQGEKAPPPTIVSFRPTLANALAAHIILFRNTSRRK